MVNRHVVGANYGSTDWIAQRITGGLIAVYVIAVGVALALVRPATHEAWKTFLANGGMRIATLVFAAVFAWHAWVGIRDVLMDYVKPTAMRLALQVIVIIVLAAYIGWVIQILWR